MNTQETVLPDSAPAAARRRDFRLFWLGGAANQLGSHASALALPLLVLALGASAVTAGAVGTVAAVTEVLLTPVFGVYADRGSRRAMMIGALLAVALAAGAIALSAGTRHATLPLLFGCTVLGGAAVAAYSAAATASIRALLPPQEPEQALGTLQAREQAAKLAGPGVGGALYQAAAWIPFLADAVSFLIAAACARAIRADLRPERERASAEASQADSRSAAESGSPSSRAPGSAIAGFRREFADGLRFLFSQPFLRFVTLWAGGVNLIIGALYYAVILTARLHGASSGLLGLTLTLAGAAGVAGALLAPRLLGLIRAGTLVVAASWTMAVVLLPLSLVASAPLWADGLVLGALSLLTPALSIVFQSKAIMLTPDVLQGRVGTALGLLGEGTGALAPIAAGALVAALRPGPQALLYAACLALLALYATVNAGRLRRDAPAPAETQAAAAETKPRPQSQPQLRAEG
jgi:MFS transporter